jgi:putative Ig domain-containing protein
MKANKAVLLVGTALLLVAFTLTAPGGLKDPLDIFVQTAHAQQKRLSIGYAHPRSAYQVGHHLYSVPVAPHCKGTWRAESFRHLSGRLPPGLRFDGSRLTGTPTQPGTWQVRVKFSGVTCGGKKYADEVLDLEIYIEGFAPRRID